MIHIWLQQKDLDLGAEAVEVPHPRFMVDDNFATLQAQKQLLVYPQFRSFTIEIS